MTPAEAKAAAAARLHTTLLAERAFGLSGVVVPPQTWEPADVEDAEPLDAEEATASEPEPRRARRPRDPEPAPEAEAGAGEEEESPALDLFGNPVVKPAAAGGGADLPPFDQPPPPRPKRIELLTAMDEDEVKGCTKCDLCKTRTHTVFGEGDPEARLMFIGEGPGQNEDETGRPFVGKAGQLLEKMIGGMKLRREDVFIANVVKCRPPDNRVPTAAETAACTPYLNRQIEIIRPTVIVTLGLPATRHLLGLQLPMGKMRGRWHEWRGIKVMPTYHPAYLLRSYTRANREAVWGDLKLVMSELAGDASA